MSSRAARVSARRSRYPDATETTAINTKASTVLDTITCKPIKQVDEQVSNLKGLSKLEQLEIINAKTSNHLKGPAIQDPKQMTQQAVETAEGKEITARILAAEAYDGDDEGASELSYDTFNPPPASSVVPSPPSESALSTLDQGYDHVLPSPEKVIEETDRGTEKRILREKLLALEQEVEELRRGLGLTADEETEQENWEDRHENAALGNAKHVWGGMPKKVQSIRDEKQQSVRDEKQQQELVAKVEKLPKVCYGSDGFKTYDVQPRLEHKAPYQKVPYPRNGWVKGGSGWLFPMEFSHDYCPSD